MVTILVSFTSFCVVGEEDQQAVNQGSRRNLKEYVTRSSCRGVMGNPLFYVYVDAEIFV